MRLGSRSGRGDGDGDESFDQPNDEPGAGRCMARRDEGRNQSSDAHGHTTPARHGGKFRSAGHGFADVAEMVGGASVNRNGLAARRAKRTRGGSHKAEFSGRPYGCQVLCGTKSWERAAATCWGCRQAWHEGSGLPGVAAEEGVPADFENVEKHLDAVAEHADFGGGGMAPAHGNFRGAQAVMTGQVKQFRVEAEALDGLLLENNPERSRLNALKPHWVSTNGSHKIRRTILLKMIPANSRTGDSRTVIRLRSTAREPMARSKCCKASMSLPASSMGAERSASVNRTMWPLASCKPWRTL